MANPSPLREALQSLVTQNGKEVKNGLYEIKPPAEQVTLVNINGEKGAREQPLSLVGIQDIGTVYDVGGTCIAIYEDAETATPRNHTKAFGDKNPTGPHHLAVYRRPVNEADTEELKRATNLSRARGLGRNTVRIVSLLEQVGGEPILLRISAGPSEAYIPLE